MSNPRQQDGNWPPPSPGYVANSGAGYDRSQSPASSSQQQHQRQWSAGNQSQPPSDQPLSPTTPGGFGVPSVPWAAYGQPPPSPSGASTAGGQSSHPHAYPAAYGPYPTPAQTMAYPAWPPAMIPPPFGGSAGYGAPAFGQMPYYPASPVAYGPSGYPSPPVLPSAPSSAGPTPPPLPPPPPPRPTDSSRLQRYATLSDSYGPPPTPVDGRVGGGHASNYHPTVQDAPQVPAARSSSEPQRSSIPAQAATPTPTSQGRATLPAPPALATVASKGRALPVPGVGGGRQLPPVPPSQAGRFASASGTSPDSSAGGSGWQDAGDSRGSESRGAFLTAQEEKARMAASLGLGSATSQPPARHQRTTSTTSNRPDLPPQAGGSGSAAGSSGSRPPLPSTPLPAAPRSASGTAIDNAGPSEYRPQPMVPQQQRRLDLDGAAGTLHGAGPNDYSTPSSGGNGGQSRSGSHDDGGRYDKPISAEFTPAASAQPSVKSRPVSVASYEGLAYDSLAPTARSSFEAVTPGLMTGGLLTPLASAHPSANRNPFSDAYESADGGATGSGLLTAEQAVDYPSLAFSARHPSSPLPSVPHYSPAQAGPSGTSTPQPSASGAGRTGYFPSSIASPATGSGGGGQHSRTDSTQARSAEKALLRLALQGRFVDDDEFAGGDGDGGDDVFRFFQPALLSHIAVQLRDKVTRGEHIKGGIPFHNSFTGKDVVTALVTFLPEHAQARPTARRVALEVARSLKSQLFLIEVDFDDVPLSDAVDDVFIFLDESEAGGGGFSEMPTGVLTHLSKCYSPSCTGDEQCYAPGCPWKLKPEAVLSRNQSVASAYVEPRQRKRTWSEAVPPEILVSLSDAEIRRQEAIHTTVLSEEQYREDLLTLETLFVLPLRAAQPPILHPPEVLEKFIEDVFTNLSALRVANERLLDLFNERQREQHPIIEMIGDVFLFIPQNFRALYAEYLSALPHAEQALDQATERFPELRTFIERASHTPDARGRDLKRFLGRPVAQLQRYSKLLDAIIKETPEDQFDRTIMAEAADAIANFALEGKLIGFQGGNGRGPHEHLEWHDFVRPEDLANVPKPVQARQHVIFEIIKGEIQYVADLESLETLFIRPLRNASPAVISRERIDKFIWDVFHNYADLLDIHRELLTRLTRRQRDQHPVVNSVNDLIFDALLQWAEAYRVYAANYPIAKWRIDRERRTNKAFQEFFDRCTRMPAAYRRDLYDFINRPIPRLLRYDLLLKEIHKMSSREGLDTDEVQQVLDELQRSAAIVDKAVEDAQWKVELWHLKDVLTVSSESKLSSSVISDLEMMAPQRQLIHKGFVRQPDGVQVHLILLDNYLLTTRLMRPREGKKDEGQQKHVLQKRPIPLSLVDLGDFSGSTIKSTGLTGGLISRRDKNEQAATTEQQEASRTVYPFSYVVRSSGAMGGTYVLWAETEAARTEWRDKLQEAKTLSDVVADGNKVFELGELSKGTLAKSNTYAPPPTNSRTAAEPNPFAGQVTCSVPFCTRDRRSLVAIGCEEGVWIGMRNNLASFSKVLHVKNVTQIACLEQFSIFLVLADHSLFAYQLDALVPSSASQASNGSRGPERLSGTAHVLFFSVGKLSGRTLVAYCKRKQLDSVFRILEPIYPEARGDHGRRGFFGTRPSGTSFRVHKDFFIPSEAKHVLFLKAKLAIVCTKGFEIMDLQNLQGGTIPIFLSPKMKESSALAALAKRVESATPLGMYRSTETEFLLCYNTFGFYVEKHGEPARGYKTIEWETIPKTVAFHPPWFLLFSWNFIEIRHIYTGKLLQIITGADARCTWDGSGANSDDGPTPGPQGYGAESATMEARIHVVMDGEKTPGQKGTPQNIYELQPTVLLDGPVAESLRPVQPHVGPRQGLPVPPPQQSHIQLPHPTQAQAQVPFRRNGPELLYPAGLEFSRPQPHHQGRPW